MLAAFVITLPFGAVRLPQSYLFAPIVQTGMFVVDLVTAALLYAQFSVVRSRGLLVLAAGCVFTAFIMIPYTVAILRLFADPQAIGAALNLPAWLYLFWHTGLPLSVIGYVWLNARAGEQPLPHERLPWATAASVAFALFAVCVLTWVAGAGYLPPIMSYVTIARSPLVFVVPALLSACAAAVLWRYRRSVLDLWLLVMLWTWLVDILLQFVPVLVERFSIGYYSGRIYGLLSTTIILIVLVVDATAINARFVISAMARRRESANRAAVMEAVTASIAHEIKQPLTSISLYSSAGATALNGLQPDLDRARAAFDNINEDVALAVHIMDATRSMFVKGGDKRGDLDCNELLQSALGALKNELEMRRITTELDLTNPLPLIHGSKTQLHQVISNLVMNSADAMSAVAGRPRILSLTARIEEAETILITIRDTGVGIQADAFDKIFEPFFTTKETGMGLGLAICRWIVATHGGELWASPNQGSGTIFYLRLPAKQGADSPPEPPLEIPEFRMSGGRE
jgi:signal transduction histidine kinase